MQVLLLQLVEQVLLVEVVVVVVVDLQEVQEILPHQVHHKDKQVVQEEMFQVVVVVAEVEAQVHQEEEVNLLIQVVQVAQE